MSFADTCWTKSITVADVITPDKVSRTPGLPQTSWSIIFVDALYEQYDAHRMSRASTIHWNTLARQREEWRCARSNNSMISGTTDDADYTGEDRVSAALP